MGTGGVCHGCNHLIVECREEACGQRTVFQGCWVDLGFSRAAGWGVTWGPRLLSDDCPMEIMGVVDRAAMRIPGGDGLKGDMVPTASERRRMASLN